MFIVYESCIMELFRSCPLCTRSCDVSTHRLGTFLSVKQHCLHCLHTRHWNSQPVLGSTPAGNLQLSAAVYLSGASFIQIEKVNNVQQCRTSVIQIIFSISLNQKTHLILLLSQYQQVFNAMNLQLFRYETFRRHARMFIEPAIVHQWKVTQDITLERLTQEQKVIFGGDMRADSPGKQPKTH